MMSKAGTERPNEMNRRREKRQIETGAGSKRTTEEEERRDR